MAQESSNPQWATPEKPHGLWANCTICNKDMRELRTRKNTCSEQCHALKVKQIAKNYHKDDVVEWATPEKPHGLWANCTICNKDMRELRTRKNTCSEECRVLKMKEIDKKSYKGKVERDPDFAKKSSARNYANIKNDPEKLEKHKLAQKKRMQLPNYKESLANSSKRYKSNPLNKPKIAKQARRYREQNPDVIEKIEDTRIQKRALERQRLKVEEPEKYQQLLTKEREWARKRKAEKELSKLQLDMNNMVDM
jgi:hypothetical protein